MRAGETGSVLSSELLEHGKSFLQSDSRFINWCTFVSISGWLMLTQPPEPRTDSAALHPHPPASPRFARLLRAKDRDSGLAIRGPGISPTRRESRASSKIFDTKHPGAPPPGNRSTHQTRGAGR